MEIRRCTHCGTIADAAGAIRCTKCEGRLELADERELIGRRFGSYTLVDVLGAGGMGVVFRARHQSLERAAAVKLLQPGSAAAQARRRFLNEARLLAGLRHPNVVAVYDFAETDWGAPYLVLELLEGRSVEELLKIGRARGEAGGLSPALVSAILADAVAGLSAAHAAGIVHRDLKPSNLFVAVENGRAVTKVIDFGIARALLPGDDATRLTATSALVGTPYYLAPEQLHDGETGPATDQYALALTVLEMLSGVAVRAGLSFTDILRLEIAAPVPVRKRLPLLPAATARALERATEPDPKRRHRDLADFLTALALPEPASGAAELLAQATAAAPGDPQATRVLGAEPNEPAAASAPATMGSAPTAALPASPAVPRRARRLALALAAVVAASAALALFVTWRAATVTAGGDLGAPSAGAERDDPALPRLLPDPLPAPADGRRIFGETETAWVLGSPGAWTLLAKGAGTATRVLWPAQVVVLGGAPDGSLWTRSGDRLVEIDPVGQSRTPRGGAWSGEWLSAPPEALAIAPRGGHVALVGDDRVIVAAIEESGPSPRFSVPFEPGTGGRVRVALTDSRLVVAQGEAFLALYRLEEREPLWRQRLSDHQITALALADGLPFLAVASAVGEVRVLEVADGDEVARLPRAGAASALLWIPDRPTLAIGGNRGLALWHPDGGAAEEVLKVPGVSGCADLALGETYLLCLDAQGSRLERLAYGAAPVRRRVELGAAEAWAAAASAGSAAPAIYVGTADGALHRLDLASGEQRRRQVHDAGITALAMAEDRLATASDDRTLAVWRLPEMEVLFRSRAHAYLVNGLDLAAGSLWSSSSDRTVKRWSWPALEEVESVDVGQATGESAELHALSVGAEGDRLWLGTWGGFAARLEREGREGPHWRAERTPIASRAGYRWAVLPGIEARVLLGVQPSALLLFDERSGRARSLPTFDRPLYALSAASARSFWAAGAATVLRFDLERTADGSIDWLVRGTIASELGVAGASAAHADTLALAGSDGGLLLLETAPLAAGPVTARGRIEP